jgi:hypothetical protein
VAHSRCGGRLEFRRSLELSALIKSDRLFTLIQQIVNGREAGTPAIFAGFISTFSGR